ncbi:MAG: hypothetical protein WAW80_03490 [Candidatus Saccharimonadales bacterium]
MQPTEPQGFYRPEPEQPVQPLAPQQPFVQSVQHIQPVQSTSVIDQAALDAALSEPVAPVAPVAPVVTTVSPATPVAADVPTEEIYENDDDSDDSDETQVSWVAHEYIHQEKGVMWFVIFGIIIASLLGVSIFLMKAWTFAAVLVAIAVVVVIYSRRPPRELTYALTDEGLIIDDSLHDFVNFKSFGVIRDGEEYSVMLIPTQRFQPGVTVYFPEEYGEDIVDMLGSKLPMKDLKLDLVDRLVRILRL